ncbi:AsmA family protein [Sphingomonas quercus]|uniref:AsmA family protein n=1 Tax=Sphingomonas quercus TaxID=2842451 RepID=A0ABS6BIG1_9SPHN|nr:AsmA family protein [Sphingomonas quercus]MBU3077019.1 AsmA family protein [Sphingomonas quercus]
MTSEQPIDRDGAAEVRAPEPPHKRRAGPLAIGLRILGAILALIVLAWAILYITKGRFLKHVFEKYASRMADRQIRVAGDFQFYFNIFDTQFLAEGLTIANPGWAPRPNFFSARLIDTRIKTFAYLFRGARHAEYLVLDGAAIDAEWDAKRRNTWTFGESTGKPFQWPVIERAFVTRTTARYVDPQLQLATDVKVDTVRSTDTRIADNRVGFTGDGTLRGRRFVMNGAILSPNETARMGRTRLVLHAASGPTLMDVSGTLPAATQIEGAALDMTVRGPNLRLLFDFLGVAVPDTRRYRFRSDLTKAGEEWRFTRLRGAFGDSDLAGRMTIKMPDDRLRIDADLASRKVDIIDIGPFLGYDPQKLATTGVQAAVAQTGTPRLLPDAPLRIESIRNFDAHVNYKVADIRQPFVPLSNLALVFDLDHSLMKLSPMTAKVSGGEVAADIVIDARKRAVLTDYDIRLSPTPLATLFRRTGFFNAGTTGTVKARVKLRGTGDTLRESLASSDGRIAIILPAGTFWTQYVQLAEFDVGLFLQKLLQDQLKKPIEINCGLIAFTVRNGVAAADPILIDTDKNVMAAKGGFSFRDESLDLAFRADGKKFSLFSGQSPVGINGYFARPGVQILSPQLLTRAGAGVALGAVASPLAAVLAFIDVGDAKAASCAPVLAGATAAAQRTTKGEPRKDVGKVSENREKAR